MRIGHGYDVHKMAAGRKCVLCGVNVPYEYGPDGHSDADVPAMLSQPNRINSAQIICHCSRNPHNNYQITNVSLLKCYE